MISSRLSRKTRPLATPAVCKKKKTAPPSPPPPIPYPPEAIYKHYDWDVTFAGKHVTGQGSILCDKRTTYGSSAYKWEPSTPPPPNGWYGTWIHNHATGATSSYIAYYESGSLVLNGTYSGYIPDSPDNIDSGWYEYSNPIWKPRRWGRDSAVATVPPAPP